MSEDEKRGVPQIETARERWLLTPLGVIGRLNIHAEQYEELRALACRAFGVPFKAAKDVPINLEGSDE